MGGKRDVGRKVVINVGRKVESREEITGGIDWVPSLWSVAIISRCRHTFHMKLLLRRAMLHLFL
jgi:hypothetical protein